MKHIEEQTEFGYLVSSEDKYIQQLQLFKVRTHDGYRKMVAFDAAGAAALFSPPGTDVKRIRQATREDLDALLKVRSDLVWPTSWKKNELALRYYIPEATE